MTEHLGQGEARLSRVERGAWEAWHVLFDIDGRPPSDPAEPLREKGGVLDPQAWCMAAARAIADGKAPPRINRDSPCPDWAIDRIKEAMT